MSNNDEKGLAPARVVEGEIVSAEVFNRQVATWQGEGLNVLTPTVALSTIPRDHSIVVNRVAINPNPAAGEVYQNSLFTKQGEVALTKVGLEKIAQCAGISIDRTERVDSRTVDFVYSFKVYGHWLGFDGTRIDRVKTKSLDLRDGSNDTKGFTPNQIAQARVHGEAVCESKAINRLYRAYGVKQKYRQEELQRPFVVCKLKWNPDMSNPVVAAIVTQINMGATSLMFPHAIDLSTVNPLQLPEHARPASGPPIDDDDDDEEEDTTPRGRSMVTTPAATSQAAPAGLQDFNDSTPAEDEDQYESVRVESVGQDASQSNFYITLEDKRVLHTNDKGMARACNTAKKAGASLRVLIAKTGNGLELVEIGGANGGY
jgi:hypothetical protein